MMTLEEREQPTTRQSKYLSYIQRYTELHGRPPAEAEIAEYLQVSAPAVHQMILSLEARRFLARTAGKPRSLQILVNLGAPQGDARAHDFASVSSAPGTEESAVVSGALAVGRDVLQRQFAQVDQHPVDDSEFAPLVRCLLEGLEAGLLAAGVSPTPAATARAALLADALDTYARWCARNDPENADPKADQQVFLHLMKYGRWPKRR